MYLMLEGLVYVDIGRYLRLRISLIPRDCMLMVSSKSRNHDYLPIIK